MTSEFPGVCPILTRLTVAAHEDAYVARCKQSVSTLNQWRAATRDLAVACAREWEGVGTQEAEAWHSHYVRLAASLEGDLSEVAA
ncbi:MAG: hypothetical protein RLZZ450_5263 [Pseudomonadota bacterium]